MLAHLRRAALDKVKQRAALKPLTFGEQQEFMELINLLLANNVGSPKGQDAQFA